MIEIALVIMIGAIAVLACIVMFKKVDNSDWLSLKSEIRQRQITYDGNDKQDVAYLADSVCSLCVQIASCTTIGDSKRGLMLAKEVRYYLDALKEKGFFK